MNTINIMNIMNDINTDISTFDRKLAFHTAPALLGIKISSLVSLKNDGGGLEEKIEEFNLRTARKGLHIKVMCRCSGRLLAFVYNRGLLKERLMTNEARDILEKFGYARTLSPEECLSRLAERVENQHDFPHEIGIFLGYPIDDVIGFIKNGGENFKLCGCWKVYSDEESAVRTFNNYNKCRAFLCRKLDQGADIYQALKIS